MAHAVIHALLAQHYFCGISFWGVAVRIKKSHYHVSSNIRNSGDLVVGKDVVEGIADVGELGFLPDFYLRFLAGIGIRELLKTGVAMAV